MQTIAQLRRAAYNRQGGRCHWCGNLMLIKNTRGRIQPHPRLCTAEHLVPLNQGGTDRAENIVAACFECNTSRPKEGGRPPPPRKASIRGGLEVSRV